MRMIKTAPSRRTFLATSVASGLGLSMQTAPAKSQARRLQGETVVRVDPDVTTLINVFTVEPENQGKLIEMLKEGTETFFSKMPGFISSSVHSGKDGRQVINYAQWRSVRDIESFRQNPNFASYIQGLTALAKADTIMCDVSYVLHA